MKMKKIAFLGDCESGIKLATGLVNHGYHVTLYSRNIGIFSEGTHSPPPPGKTDTAARVDSFRFTALCHDTHQYDALMQYYNSGGILKSLSLHEQQHDDVIREHDLVIMSSSESAILANFKISILPSDNTKLKLHRNISACYVSGLDGAVYNNHFTYRNLPGLGEYYITLTENAWGASHLLFIEAIPGSEFDCLLGIKEPNALLEKMKTLIHNFIPDEYETIKNTYSANEHVAMNGTVTPLIREPVFSLSATQSGLLIGDVALINDLKKKKKAALALKTAEIYLEAIIAHGENLYDETWMYSLFNRYWAAVKNLI